jgi:hypothetical protein
MNAALKVVMTIYGAIGAMFGLAYLFVTRQAIAIQGFEGDPSAYLVSNKMVLGTSILVVGIFVIIAARDPIKHILWVKFTIVFATLFLTVALYTGFVIFADLSQAIVGIIIHGVSAVALLISYPWRIPQDGE